MLSVALAVLNFPPKAASKEKIITILHPFKIGAWLEHCTKIKHLVLYREFIHNELGGQTNMTPRSDQQKQPFPVIQDKL